MPHSVSTRSSELYDLLFHCVSWISIAHDDVSRLGDPRYLAFCDTLALDESLRTLPADSALLGNLYNASPLAHSLQSLPALYDDVDSLVRDAPHPFESLNFAPPWRQGLAEALRKAVSMTLLELFRVAAWAEERAGFVAQMAAAREAHRAERDALDQAFTEAAAAFPELLDAELFSCPALGRRGRLLNPAGRRVIVVGAPWPELGLEPWAAVIQGCHERVLDEVLARLETRPKNVSTKSQAAGFAEHMRAESVAAAVLASRCLGNRCEAPYRAWWAASSPKGWATLLRGLPWTPSDLVLPESEALIGLIADGHFVPPDLRPLYESLRSRT